MQTQTFISGKDLALEDSIAYFQQQLSHFGFNVEPVSWLESVPNVWSVHVCDIKYPACFANGKGTTKKAALASALGEYIERLSTNYFFADFYLGQDIANSDFVHYPNEKWFLIPDEGTLPTGMLDHNLHAFYNPDAELRASDLTDLQSGNAQRGICTLPFIRQSDNEIIYIPVNIIGNLYVSNGMSAGNTPNEARVQALSEIIERYVKNKIIAEAISLPIIPTETLECYSNVIDAINKLETAGFPTIAYDASLNGQYPLICIILFTPSNGGCFASFGAHPNTEIALERTLTELLQGRSIEQLNCFPPPSFANDEVADNNNLETHFIDSSGLISWDMFKQPADYPFVDWSFNGTTEQTYYYLMAIFQQQQFDVYIADYQQLGVYTCRIIVPGISEIYPVDDLLLANNNMAADIRETILNLPATDWEMDAYMQLLNQLDEQDFDDFVRVRELTGIATNKNDNSWHSLRLGELKALLALAGGDLKQAQDWVEWTLEVNQFNFSKKQSDFYRCLQTILSLINNSEKERTIDDYLAAFTKMYGKQTVNDALEHIKGQQRFYDLFAIDARLTQLPAHQSLLSAYQKVQDAKRQYELVSTLTSH